MKNHESWHCQEMTKIWAFREKSISNCPEMQLWIGNPAPLGFIWCRIFTGPHLSLGVHVSVFRVICSEIKAAPYFLCACYLSSSMKIFLLSQLFCWRLPWSEFSSFSSCHQEFLLIDMFPYVYSNRFQQMGIQHDSTTKVAPMDAFPAVPVSTSISKALRLMHFSNLDPSI
jgi:hypothetical protein